MTQARSKAMFALAGAEVRVDDVRAALPGGWERAQVNVPDDAVAAGLRLEHHAPAFTGVVSVWGAVAEPALLTNTAQALTALAPVVVGWEVEERRPLEPPIVSDGVRAEALANVAFLRRPAELSVDAWKHRWLVDHTPVAIATQGTFGYVQNVVTRPLDDTSAATGVAALVEELFPMAALTDVHAFYGSDGTDADLTERMTRLLESCARFGADRDLDLLPTSRYLLAP